MLVLYVAASSAAPQCQPLSHFVLNQHSKDCSSLCLISRILKKLIVTVFASVLVVMGEGFEDVLTPPLSVIFLCRFSLRLTPCKYPKAKATKTLEVLVVPPDMFITMKFL